jgi:hypothetical protein
MRSVLFLFTMVAAACVSRAATIIVKITGTISSGSDMSGVFSPFAGCSSRTPCNLAGLPFTLTFTFNDTLGLQYQGSNISYITQSPTSNPGTAILTINGSSFEFAAPAGRIDLQSSAQSDTPPGRYDEYSVGASDLGSSVAGNLYPANGRSFGNSADWRKSFTYLGAFATGDVLVANIAEEPGLTYYAHGITLVPNGLQVDGISTTTCSSADVNVSFGAASNLSQTAHIQYMQATFIPPNGVTLLDYATSCGFDNLNWQQQITTDPGGGSGTGVEPNNRVPLIATGNVAHLGVKVSPASGLCVSDWTGCSLIAPPPYYDPPAGGYQRSGLNPYPFYYPPEYLVTDVYCPLGTLQGFGSIYCSLGVFPFSFPYVVNSNDTTFAFFDAPSRGNLPGVPAAPNPPAGSFIAFTTSLVGVSFQFIPGSVSCGPNNSFFCTRLFTWNWNTTFNGKSGGVSPQ